MTNVLWLIPARSGSKGIPDKNIKPLNGVPLLAYRIKTALAITTPDHILVSTDSEAYAAVSESFGVKVPFLRPAELATDEAKSEDAVLHAMEWAESIGRNYDAVGLLQPTSPYIKADFLVQAVHMLMGDNEAESIVAVREVKPNTVYVQELTKYLEVISRRIKERGNKRRQDLKKEITPSGGFFIAKWEVFKQKKTFYPEKTLTYLIPDIYGLDIDEPQDWLWAEFLVEKNLIQPEELLKLSSE